MRIMFIFKNTMFVKGGIETVSSVVIDNLIKNGNVIKLVVLSPNKESYDKSKWVDPFLNNKDKVDLFLIDKESKLNFAKALLKSFFGFKYNYLNFIEKSIRDFMPDYIIVVGNPFLISSAKKALKVNNIKAKVVYWDHGFLFSFFLTSRSKLINTFKFLLKKHIVKLHLKDADGFLAISSGIKSKILSFLRNANVYVVFNPLKNYDGQLIKRPSNPKFIYVGRLSEHEKNISFLLKGMKNLINKNWHLKIIGTGPDEMALKNLSIELGLSDRIEWLGFKKDPYENLDEGVTALLLTSRFEGFGMVLAEANQRGIPVISSDCQPGSKDIVIPGKNGYLYPEGDMDAFVKVVNDVIDGKLNFGTPKEIAKTAERFSEDVVCNNIVNALKKIGSDQEK